MDVRTGVTQPRYQGPLSSSLEKVPWLRLVTCLRMPPTKAAQRVGPQLKFSQHSFEVLGYFPFERKFRNFRSGDKWNGNFQEKNIRKFGYTSRGCPLFRKLCIFAIFYSALVLLAPITACWTSHARMTETRIRKWKYLKIFPLICR